MIGKKIGNYEIVDKIGAGGMGEVYRARDTKLNRDVAVKVLPDLFADDTDRLSRFEREARLLAGLNHPGIGAIYGLEEFEGARYLILELVEGEDLSKRLERGALPVTEALNIAHQIAAALETAHEQGVIHRDLKPANIQLTADGCVKVLDFGLAKALATSADNSGSELSQSPTVMSSPTVAGVILGTAAYMSPEQARGKPVDKRSDIFAFGIVLYEMLTGTHMFAGDTVSDTLAAVLRAEPEFERLPSDTPAALRRLLERCLEKEGKRRLRDIGEARIIIEDIQAGKDIGATPAAAGTAPAAQGGKIRQYGGWLLAAVAVVASTAMMLMKDGHDDSAPPPLRKSKIQLSSDDPSRRTTFHPAISPDGRYVVYLSGGKSWLRDLTAIDAHPIGGTEGALKPFWSPDSKWIGFGMGTTLQRVGLDGGQPTPITTFPSGLTLSGAADGCWTEDGRIVIGPSTTTLQVVSAQGGEVTEFIQLGEGETDVHQLCRLPGDRGFVFVIHSDEGIGNLDVLTSDLERRVLLRVEDTVASPTYSPSGHILFQRSGATAGIWAIPFSLEQLEPTGEPFLVVAGGIDPSISSDGTLCYVHGVTALQSQLVWFNREGEAIGTIGRPGVTSRPFPQLSPDEKYLVMAMTFGDGRELYLFDLASGNRRRLTFDDLRDDLARWHPNGTELLSYDSGTYGSRFLSVDGSAEPRHMANGIMPYVTPDGKQLLYAKQIPNEWNWDIHVMPYGGDDSDSRQLVATPGVDWWPTLSPDGRILLYVSNETGRDEVYATTFPTPTTRWQVSTEGGQWPAWRGDGKEIFFTTHNEIWAVDATIGDGLTLGTPHVLFRRPSTNWSTRWADAFDVTKDGERFVMMRNVRGEDDIQPAIIIVQNWVEEFTHQ
jgi:serine/threonine protein kinase